MIGIFIEMQIQIRYMIYVLIQLYLIDSSLAINMKIQRTSQQKTDTKWFKEQFKRRKFLEAHQKLAPFDLMLSMIKLSMSGNEQEKQEQIQKRISKFFGYGEKSVDLKNGYFCERRQPSYSRTSAQPIPNELVIYGIDFMPIKKMRARFEQFKPQIIRMDDSHYKAIFKSDEDALRAIQGNIKDNTILKVKEEEEQYSVPTIWFELNPYEQMGFERKLFCRYATTEEDDVNIQSSQKVIEYRQAKKQYEANVIREGKGIYLDHIRCLPISNGSKRKFGNTERLDTSFRQRSREKKNAYSNRNQNNGRRNDRQTRIGRGQTKDQSAIKPQKVVDLNQSDSQESPSYDFILSPRLLRELEGLDLDDKIQSISMEEGGMIEESDHIDLDFQMEQNVNLTPKGQVRDDLDLDQEDSRNMPQSKWSYSQYVNEQQRRQQTRRKQKNKRQLIVID